MPPSVPGSWLVAESMLLLDRHDAVLLDLDGTVYRGARPITGVPETITSVRRRGVAVRFVTNNAAKAPSAVAEHLTALGVAADAGEVSTSAQAAAQVLRQRLPEGAAVLVVGTASLAAEVDVWDCGRCPRPGRPMNRPSGSTPWCRDTHPTPAGRTWRGLAWPCELVRTGSPATVTSPCPPNVANFPATVPWWPR